MSNSKNGDSLILPSPDKKSTFNSLSARGKGPGGFMINTEPRQAFVQATLYSKQNKWNKKL